MAVAAPTYLSPLLYHAPLAYVAPIEAKIHYATHPVVVGHSASILKPVLGAPVVAAAAAAAAEPVAEEKKEETAETKTVAVVQALAPYALHLAAPVPAGDAPAWSELVQTEKIQAPVRTISQVTPEVTVQLAPKVNIEKVPVEISVPTPYAHPVPHPVPVPYAHPFPLLSVAAPVV